MNVSFIRDVEQVKTKILSLDVPTSVLLMAVKGATIALETRLIAEREGKEYE